jgi:ABC-2 type transport system ATP-binding protein
MIRAETTAKDAKSRYVVGTTKIKYIKEREAERYVEQGYTIKPVTLEDLFVIRGVELEP